AMDRITGISDRRFEISDLRAEGGRIAVTAKRCQNESETRSPNRIQKLPNEPIPYLCALHAFVDCPENYQTNPLCRMNAVSDSLTRWLTSLRICPHLRLLEGAFWGFMP